VAEWTLDYFAVTFFNGDVFDYFQLF